MQPVNLEVFERTKRCLASLCNFLANRVPGKDVQVTLDYIVCQPKNAQRLLRCLRPMAPLKQLCLGTRGCFYISRSPPHMESGELEEIRDLTKQESSQLVARKDFLPSNTSPRELPFEIQSMIVSHTVVSRDPIPLRNYRSETCLLDSTQSGAVDNVVAPIGTTENDCRRTDFESYSMSCQCITLREGIFFASTAIRLEALKLYWTENTFIFQGQIDAFFHNPTAGTYEPPNNRYFGGLIHRSLVPRIYRPHVHPNKVYRHHPSARFSFNLNVRTRLYTDRRSFTQALYPPLTQPSSAFSSRPYHTLFSQPYNTPYSPYALPPPHTPVIHPHNTPFDQPFTTLSNQPFSMPSSQLLNKYFHEICHLIIETTKTPQRLPIPIHRKPAHINLTPPSTHHPHPGPPSYPPSPPPATQTYKSTSASTLRPPPLDPMVRFPSTTLVFREHS